MAQELEFIMQLNAIYSGTENLQRASKDFSALNERTKNLQATSRNISAYQKQQTSLAQTAQRLNTAQYRVKQLATEMHKTTNPSAQMRKEFTRANIDASKLQRTLQEQRKHLGELQKSLKEAGVNTNDFAREQQRLTDELDRTRQAQERAAASRERLANIKQNLSWQGIKQNIIQPALPLAATVAPMVRAAGDFEAAMAGVKAVGFSSKDADLGKFEMLKAQALQLGADTKFTSVQAAQAQEMLMRANYTPEEVISTMPALLNMAAAERLELAQAADILAGVKGGMNMRADQSTQISDILAYTSTTSKLDIPTLAEGLKQVAPLASVQGVKLEQLSAMIGVLANKNFDASTITTQLRNIFLSVNDSTKRQKLIELGIKTRTREGNMAAIPEIMKQLDEKLAKFSPAQQVTMLGDIFNSREVPIIQALMTASKSGEVQRYEQNIFTQNKGTTQRMSDINLDTLNGQLDILSSAWGNLKITVGDIFTPIVREGVEALSSLLSSVNSVIKEFPNASKYIIEGIAAITATKTLIGVANIGRALLAWPFAAHARRVAEIAASSLTVGENIGAAAKGASMFGGALSFSAGQIGLIVAGLVLIIQHWKEITEWAGKAGEAMKSVDRSTPIQELRKQGKTTDYHIRAMESPFAIPSLEPEAQFARGGIISRPTIGLIGEAGREAIVPLQNKSRGIPLLMQAAKTLGVFPEVTRTYDNISSSMNRGGDTIMSLSDMNHDMTAHNNTAMTTQNTQQQTEPVNPAKPRSMFSSSRLNQRMNEKISYRQGQSNGHGMTRNIFTNVFDRISRNSNSRTVRNAVEIGRTLANNTILRGTQTAQNDTKTNKLSDYISVFTSNADNNTRNIFNLAQDLERMILNDRNAESRSNTFYSNNNNYNGNNRPSSISININATNQSEQDLASRIAGAVREALSEIEGLKVRTSYA